MSIMESLKGAGSRVEEASIGASGSSGDTAVSPISTQTHGGSGGKWGDVYAANTMREGLRAVFRVVPYWVPAVGLVSGLGVYYFVFRVRLFLSQWRMAERRRAERKYDLLENLRGVSIGPVGAVEPLVDDGDGDDEDEEEEDDETAVSMYDVDEFRSSLGIRLPRDEDLLGIVEKMLLVDPIPDGWVLYRTTAGIIRFMNLNTQELFFFHPGKRKEKAFIEEELKRRNRQAMESKYSFSYEDEGMNSLSMSARSSNARAMGNPGPSPLDFGDDGAAAEDDETQNSTFKRMFNYFLEKEQKRIEQDVAKARSSVSHRGSTAGSSGNSPRVGGLPGSHGSSAASPTQRGITPGGAGNSGGGAGGTGGVGGRPPMPSSTYRVVASSAIHGSRGPSVNN